MKAFGRQVAVRCALAPGWGWEKQKMRSKVTEHGVLIPKQLLQDVEEVDIRKEQDVSLVVPVASQDPVMDLGTEPIADGPRDASERHDDYLYGRC